MTNISRATLKAHGFNNGQPFDYYGQGHAARQSGKIVRAEWRGSAYALVSVETGTDVDMLGAAAKCHAAPVDICHVCTKPIPTGMVDAGLHPSPFSAEVIGWSCSPECTDAHDAAVRGDGMAYGTATVRGKSRPAARSASGDILIKLTRGAEPWRAATAEEAASFVATVTTEDVCTFPDTTFCTSEHRCGKCGKHLEQTGECPGACDEEDAPAEADDTPPGVAGIVMVGGQQRDARDYAGLVRYVVNGNWRKASPKVAGTFRRTPPPALSYDAEVRSVMLDECPLSQAECDDATCAEHNGHAADRITMTLTEAGVAKVAAKTGESKAQVRRAARRAGMRTEAAEVTSFVTRAMRHREGLPPVPRTANAVRNYRAMAASAPNASARRFWLSLADAAA